MQAKGTVITHVVHFRSSEDSLRDYTETEVSDGRRFILNFSFSCQLHMQFWWLKCVLSHLKSFTRTAMQKL